MPRNDPRDVLVSRDGQLLNELPAGARIGTGSIRRAAQVLAHRPDLEIVLLRGNVDTRVRKVTGEGREIEADSKAGRLDFLATEADEAKKNGTLVGFG